MGSSGRRDSSKSKFRQKKLIYSPRLDTSGDDKWTYKWSSGNSFFYSSGGLMASISRINNRVQAIDPANGGVFGLELLQAVGQFLLQNNGASGAVPNVEDVPPPINDLVVVDDSHIAPHPAQDCTNDCVDEGVVNGLTYQMVAPLFKLPLGEAARRLDISRSSLMIWSRVHRIPRWPYRMIQSLEKLISVGKLYGVGGRCKGKRLDFTIEELEQRKREFEKDPSVPIEASILHFRTLMLKRASTKKREALKKHNG